MHGIAFGMAGEESGSPRAIQHFVNSIAGGPCTQQPDCVDPGEPRHL